MKVYYENEWGTLWHGDCLEVMEWLPVEYGEGWADMVLCDPPYGTTQNKWDAVIPFGPMWSGVWSNAKENVAVVMTAQPPFDKVLGSSCIKHLKYEWVWEKAKATGHLNANKQPMKAHENVLVFYRKQCRYSPQKTDGEPYTPGGGSSKLDNYGAFDAVRISGEDGRRFPRTVQRFTHEINPLHPTQKPVALFAYLIATYTDLGETVFDFCAGSGTTAVAAESIGRRWVLIEKEEKYCEIIAKRLDARRN